jgi:hypothetical protein
VKYKLKDGRICTKHEMSLIFASISTIFRRIEFEIWLQEGIDNGTIEVVEGEKR